MIREITRAIRSLPKIVHILEHIMLNIEKLTQDVAAQTNVVVSAVELLTGLTKAIGDLKSELAAAIAANDPTAVAAVQASIDALDAQLSDNTTKLATAVAANTTPASS